MSKEDLHRFRLPRGPKPSILIMGGALVFGLLILASFFLFAQELTHVVSVVNIEIPTRVFKGDKFIDNLTIKDFEVYEDGKLQPIEAVYLIKKADTYGRRGKKILNRRLPGVLFFFLK